MPIKIAELFAGVGGFREAVEFDADLRKKYTVAWSNQWEPSESQKAGADQAANRVYIAKFGKSQHSTEDIFEIAEGDLKGIPKFDMLVGGFPCQDYSVAKPKNTAKGIRGPKGVLWWSIEYIVRKREPRYILLENVDRLVNSPANNRGRDFAVILKGLDDLGYCVEWRVVNAADYGFPQKRRRIFILAYRGDSKAALKMKGAPAEVLSKAGYLARALKCSLLSEPTLFDLNKYQSDDELGKKYETKNGKSPFGPAGYMLKGKAWSATFESKSDKPRAPLSSILLDSKKKTDIMPADMSAFEIAKEAIEKWAYAKGRKNEPRRKSAAVLKFLRHKLAGRKTRAGHKDIQALAKALPEKLEMDAAISCRYAGKTALVKIAREELHPCIVALLYAEFTPANRPVGLDRDTINELLSKQSTDTLNEVVDSAASIVTERAASLLGLKHNVDDLEDLHKTVIPGVRQAVISLLAETKPKTFEIGDTKITVSRDELADNSFAYGYKEGGLPFPDPVKSPGRTIITSEGGASVSRFKHVICRVCAENPGAHKHPEECVRDGKLRRLYPEELERMNGFSAVHSQKCRELKVSNGRRAFFMGNALVVGIVRSILGELPS